MSDNPFVRYRDRLDSYAAATAAGMSDADFVALVAELDEAVAGVEGHGFRVTPVTVEAGLAAAAGLDVELHVKSEVDNVGGSHKARHLMGVALRLLVDEWAGGARADRLAIASCGNAALGAGVVARALGRPLEVFVPTWAEAPVIERLDRLGAHLRVCERRAGEAGDPCFLRFEEAVAAGARPFSVQAVSTPAAFDGGRTLGWELAEQAPGLDAVYVQVGGGALATSVSRGLGPVTLHPVQAEGCAPLRRAWDRLAPRFDFDVAESDPDRFMWPWEDPTSVATGILDDVTYDWLPLLRRTRETGGWPVVAPEALVVEAHRLARTATTIPVSPTGSAGLAGLLAEPPAPGSRVAVLFTGVDRGEDGETADELTNGGEGS
jgi:threonine synthase